MAVAVFRAPTPAFYQAASSLLAVVLLSGIIAEMRTVRDGANGRRSAPRPWEVYLFAVVCMVAVLGEVFALNAIARPPGPVVQAAIGFAVVIGILALPLMVGGPLVRSVDQPARKRVTWAAFGVFVTTSLLVGLIMVKGIVDGRPGLGSPTLGYRVAGTCANHACGLNAHSAPATRAPIPALRPAYQDGDEILVVCQIVGRRAVARDGASSSLWDQTADGLWVSDLFVSAPARASIPRCAGSGDAHSG